MHQPAASVRPLHHAQSIFAAFDAQDVAALPCCNVFRLRDGLVSDYRSYMDISPVYA